MLVGIGILLLVEHGAEWVGVVAGALENLKLAVLIVCQRESLSRAHADFVFLEGFENGRVQRRQLQHEADIGGGDAERRSEEGRVGKEGVHAGSFRWWPYTQTTYTTKSTLNQILKKHH